MLAELAGVLVVEAAVFFHLPHVLASMSDFDKEAEREKLRKKYARDEEKRAHTQRMSELLLQGATMTSSHCEQCGDPLFRHNGQTFCASCQADADQSAAGTASSAEAPADVDVDAVSAVRGADDTSVSHLDAGDDAAPTASANSTKTTDTEAATHGAAGTAGAGRDTDLPAENRPRSTSAGTDRAADLTAARSSLERTVARFAKQAESTDDPRRAREHLAAAREAAETLDALD